MVILDLSIVNVALEPGLPRVPLVIEHDARRDTHGVVVCRGGDPPTAPDFAQHTDQVLSGLGFSNEQIARLRADGVVV
jgi:crotonobetainyl-CoA:carnitine CoA-transferase CaiB-like acyl-CoA transferase